MPPVTMLVKQLEFTRRTRSCRLMPVTRGSSPTWGADIVASMGGRRGSMPDQDRGRVRGRQERVVSTPDQRQVEQGRIQERERGGPPAPHNSLDMSIINLNETVAIDEEPQPEVFYTPRLATLEDNLTFDDDSSFDDVDIVPPVDPNARAILDANIAQRSSLNMTIDLTDSPVRSSSPPSNQSPPSSPTPAIQSSSSNTSSSPSSASLKCPVCLEAFSSIRRRGSRLVSTLCGHVFCGKCLPACVRTSGQCPTCRRRLGYQDFHPVYLF